MNRLRAKRATTCIYVQVRRLENTYFILCDEYDMVESLKSRMLNMLAETGFQWGGEDAITTEDIKLSLQRRVSLNSFIFSLSILIYRSWTLLALATISKSSTTPSSTFAYTSQARKTISRRLKKSHLESTSSMTTMATFARPQRGPTDADENFNFLKLTQADQKTYSPPYW